MNTVNRLFIYFLGILFGVVVALFIFYVVPDAEGYDPIIRAIIVASMVAVSLMVAHMRVVHDVIIDLRKKITSLEGDQESNSKFLSFASHEIKNPLATIRWSLSALLSGQYGAIPPDQKSLLERILGDSEELEAIVAAFLDASKIRLHVLEIALAPMRLDELEKECAAKIQSYMPSAVQKGITLSYTPQVDPKAMVRINKTTTQLVLENLLKNAFNYTSSGGSVSVTLQTDAHNVIFRIADTGIGIPKADQPRLFNEFFRAENARRFQPFGSGLGLYLSKKYIEAHGGTIQFTSEENKGTVFIVTIPLYAGNEVGEVFRKI